MLHPPQNGRVCQIDAALAHHRHQVAIAQLETEIPANAQDHDLLVEVPTFKELFDRHESRHRSIISEPVSRFAPEPSRWLPPKRQQCFNNRPAAGFVIDKSLQSQYRRWATLF